MRSRDLSCGSSEDREIDGLIPRAEIEVTPFPYHPQVSVTIESRGTNSQGSRVRKQIVGPTCK